MPTNNLYHTWFQRISELRPGQRVTQIRAFTWLIVGIYQSCSVKTSKIALKIPGTARLVSVTRRLSRLLSNPAIRVRDWYRPIAQVWLEAQASQCQQIKLIVDGTKIGFGHQLLMVAIAYRRRSIPIAWTWVPYVKGRSPVHQQLALLGYVRSLLPKGIAVLWVGDQEFSTVAVLRQLEVWGWDYVIRIKGDTHICLARDTAWQDFKNWVQKPGQSRWLGAGYLTEKEIYPVHLLVHWQVGEEEPWCLATSLPDRQMTLKAYARRMWIEEMFGDLKGHGFDLESTMLRHFQRLSRLTLAVALLYVWLMATGTRTVHNGKRTLVDRKERRDLSVFQIGFRIIERKIVNGFPLQIRFCAYL